MGKRSTTGGPETVQLLARVADAFAARPDAGAPLGDARLLRELAARLLDARDPWQALALDAIARALDEGTPMSTAGALALAEMLRELEEPPESPESPEPTS
jgi:hypothetical protein